MGTADKNRKVSINRQQTLYEKIMDFQIDDGATHFSFKQRLARENGWSDAFAARVIREYKRFIYLMVTAGHPVTPSDQIDQAWHLHLSYTRSYWDRLCRQVIGQSLHHNPTQGGAAERHKFDQWYRRTLDSYQCIFKEPPAADLWPEPSVRFGYDLFFRRINFRNNWVIRKPKLPRFVSLTKWRLASFGLVMMGIVVSVPLAAIGSTSSDNTHHSLLWGIFPIVIMFFIGGVKVAKQRRERRCPTCGQFNALYRTDTIEAREGNEKWEEFRCEGCNSTTWKKLRDDSGGGGGGCGGGCSGCGGCGG